MLLFTLNEASTANAVQPNTACNTKMRLHGFRMTDGDVVQCDLVPVVKDGVGYLYDRVTGELKGNLSGSGAFTPGGAVLDAADITTSSALLYVVPHRTVSIEATNRVDGVVASVHLAFGPESVGRTNVLFAAYGPTEGGEGADGWAHCDRVGVVPPEMTGLDYSMPAGWGGEQRAIRFFLAPAPEAYDFAVDYLESTGQEWINTECTHPSNVVVECETTLLSPTVNDYNTPFGSRLIMSGNYHNGLYFFTRYAKQQIAGVGRTYRENRDSSRALPMNVPVMIRVAGFAGYWSTNNVALGRLVTSTVNNAVEQTGAAPMFVFTMNEASTAGGVNANTACNTRMRLHAFRMSSATDLLCDLQPVVVNGEGAIYDRVSGQLRRNGSGAGAFLVGPARYAGERVRSASAMLTASAGEPFGRALRHRACVSFGRYGGRERLAGFPALLTVSPSTCAGFDYAQCAPDGSDLRFADEQGAILPHEIDTWNTNGTSLVWVRLPVLTPEGASAWMGWGRTSRPLPPTPAACETWRDYAAVWHFGEASGTAHDSGPYGFDAVPVGETAADSVGTNVITLGVSRYIPAGCHFEAGSWDKVAIGSALSASGWFRLTAHQTGQSPLLFSNKTRYDDTFGWYMAVQEYANQISVNGGGGGRATRTGTLYKKLTDDWGYLATTLNDGTACLYYNVGQDVHKLFQTSAHRPADTANTLLLFDTQYGDYTGFADEMRIRIGATSQDRIAADLKTMADPAFAAFGAIEDLYPPGMLILFR